MLLLHSIRALFSFWEFGMTLMIPAALVMAFALQAVIFRSQKRPWVPIAVVGGVLVLLTLYKLRDKPWLEFWATVVVCGVVEYFTAYYLETVYDRRW